MKNPILILINEQIELINKVNSHNIIIPLKNEKPPQEIKISLHGLPVWSEINRKARLFECSDINIYSNSKNITNEFINKLIPIIDQYGSKEEYSKALDNLLQKQERNGFSEGYILKRKIDDIKTLLTTNKLSYFLKENYKESDSKYVLGNKTPYHLFNFIYNGVNLPSVTLLNENEEKFSNLYISSGKNPSIDDTFKKYEQGGINIQVELYYNNPLDKLLKDILKRLTRLHKQIDYDRTNYLDPISNSTDVIHTDLTNGINKIASEVDTIAKNIEQIG